MTGSIVVCDGGLTAGYRFTDWEAVEQPGDPRSRQKAGAPGVTDTRQVGAWRARWRS